MDSMPRWAFTDLRRLSKPPPPPSDFSVKDSNAHSRSVILCASRRKSDRNFRDCPAVIILNTLKLTR